MGEFWTMIFVIVFIYFLGQRVEKHRKRIDDEINRGIVHKYELKNNKIGDKNVVIEFAPPKGLSPIEVGYLYDMEIGESDIVCLLYKWAGMGIISLSSRDNGLLIVEKKGSIYGKNLPEYEVKFWDLFFELGDSVIFPNNFLYDDLWNFKDLVRLYCRYKGWIIDKDVYFSLDDFFKKIIPWMKPSKDITYIPYGRLIGFLFGFFLIIVGVFLFFGSLIVGKMVSVFGAVFMCLFVIGVLISFSFAVTLSETKNKPAVGLTEKGQELLAEIYGYKKFLEKCDEKQLRALMKEDPLYLDKVLPYAVALGLENIISEKLPKNLSVEEGSLADILRFEKVI